MQDSCFFVQSIYTQYVILNRDDKFVETNSSNDYLISDSEKNYVSIISSTINFIFDIKVINYSTNIFQWLIRTFFKSKLFLFLVVALYTKSFSKILLKFLFSNIYQGKNYLGHHYFSSNIMIIFKLLEP